MVKVNLLAALAVAASTQFAQAQSTGDYTVGAGLSTFGATLEGTYQIDPNFRVRGLVMGGLSYDGTESDDQGNEYEVDANLGAVALLADYYPYANGWRVSGGLLFSNTDLTGTASAGNGETIEVNGTEYSNASLETSAAFKKEIAPMITTGYDYSFADNWVVSGEIGAIYTGGVALNVTGNGIPQSEINADPDYRAARDDASDLTFYPYISVTVGYRF